jgi:hypothetical protein
MFVFADDQRAGYSVRLRSVKHATPERRVSV